MSSGPLAWVRPGLLLSSASAERDATLLKSTGVTHVLQCGVGLVPSHPQEQGQFTYLSLPLLDVVEQDLISCFPDAFAFIEGAFSAGACVCRRAHHAHRGILMLPTQPTSLRFCLVCAVVLCC